MEYLAMGTQVKPGGAFDPSGLGQPNLENAMSDAQVSPTTGSDPVMAPQVMMQRCLTLAHRALGRTAPNPLVGCVIVRDGQIVGEGFHPSAGQPHAEVFALQAAGEQARGATLFVNLEPCNHYGRTPPCTEAIVAAGISRVVVGMVDPDPRVSGRGIAQLRSTGIEVVVGVEAADCQGLNEAFIHRVRYHRPFGILKYAMTLDGKIATTSGHSTWVTDPAARAEVYRLRAACDAVIVGGNTLRHDNPQLTAHRSPSVSSLQSAGQDSALSSVAIQNPLRVVMSRSLRVPAQAHLWETGVAPTLVLTEVGANVEFQQYLIRQGVEVVTFDDLTPAAAMTHLYERGLLSVFWECGGTLAAPAIASGAVQKVMAFIAPKIIGGGTAPVGELGLTTMTQALSLERLQWRSIGSDYLVEGYLPQKLWDPV